MTVTTVGTGNTARDDLARALVEDYVEAGFATLVPGEETIMESADGVLVELFQREGSISVLVDGFETASIGYNDDFNRRLLVSLREALGF